MPTDADREREELLEKLMTAAWRIGFDRVPISPEKAAEARALLAAHDERTVERCAKKVQDGATHLGLVADAKRGITERTRALDAETRAYDDCAKYLAALAAALRARVPVKPGSVQASPDGKHQWQPPYGVIKHEHCASCMVIRRADGKTNREPCRGPSALSLRAPDAGGKETKHGA